MLLAGELGSKIVFVLSLFGPGLLLAFRSKWALVPAIVPLGYLLLSDYPGEHTHHNQYGAPLIPLALGASILGFATLSQRGRLRRRLTGAALLATIALSLAFGAIPFTPGFSDAFLRGNPDRAPAEGSILVREARYEPFLAAVATIPVDASISSRDFFTTQVPERRLNYHLNGLDPYGPLAASLAVASAVLFVPAMMDLPAQVPTTLALASMAILGVLCTAVAMYRANGSAKGGTSS